MMNNIENSGAQQARDIPTPPGGGSWTFNEIAWKWVSSDSAPAEETSPAPAADMVTTNNELEQGA